MRSKIAGYGLDIHGLVGILEMFPERETEQEFVVKVLKSVHDPLSHRIEVVRRSIDARACRA